jgi:hypothetical protein
MQRKSALNILQSIVSITGENPHQLKSYMLTIHRGKIYKTVKLSAGSIYQAIRQFKNRHPDWLVTEVQLSEH